MIFLDAHDDQAIGHLPATHISVFWLTVMILVRNHLSLSTPDRPRTKTRCRFRSRAHGSTASRSSVKNLLFNRSATPHCRVALNSIVIVADSALGVCASEIAVLIHGLIRCRETEATRPSSCDRSSACDRPARTSLESPGRGKVQHSARIHAATRLAHGVPQQAAHPSVLRSLWLSTNLKGRDILLDAAAARARSFRGIHFCAKPLSTSF